MPRPIVGHPVDVTSGLGSVDFSVAPTGQESDTDTRTMWAGCEVQQVSVCKLKNRKRKEKPEVEPPREIQKHTVTSAVILSTSDYKLQLYF